MLKYFFLVLNFLYSTIAVVEFICPKKHANPMDYTPSYLGTINCQNLNLECALLHEGNIPLLEAIQSLKCDVNTISPSLFKAEEKITLSVLNEDTAVAFLENQICMNDENMMHFSVPYMKLARNKMFFRKLSCSIGLIQKLFDIDFPNYIRHIFKSEIKDENDFRNKILDMYHPKLFKGIWSTNKPYLTRSQIDVFIDQIYYGHAKNADKTFTYISQMMKGSFNEPLRDSLNKDGVYKDYEYSSDESYVHVCQAVRQNFFPQILTEIKEVSKYEKSYENRKRAEKLNIKLQLIYFCDDLINPENSTEGKIFWLVLVPGAFVFHVIFFHYWQNAQTYDENLEEKKNV